MAAAHGGRSVDLMPVPLSPPRRVVIAGGGVAAVETALALRALPRGAALDLTIVAPGVHLVYRPLAVLEPFAPPRQRRYRLDEICADLDASFVRDRVDRVVPGDRVVVTEGGQAIGYDVLVIASRAVPENAGQIGADILDALGSGGVLVNISRGFLIDEDALLLALRDRTIAGAALDVFADEPTDPMRWRDLPNVVLTPHLAGYTVEAGEDMTRQLRENILRYFAGQPLLTPVSDSL